jgi:hypothetical protein
MLKSIFKNIGLAVLTLMLVQVIAFAQTSDTEPDDPSEAAFQSRCTPPLPKGYPPCADSPSDCGSKVDPEPGSAGGEEGEGEEGDKKTDEPTIHEPFNCIFLREPIGGDPGYDLYRYNPSSGYVLWHGEAIVGEDSGPFQALLAFEEGKELQGPFGLLYNYLGLVYNWLSGVIIAFVILIAIVGGIRMSTSAGNQEQFTAGKNMIIKALVGMVIWFTASVILYTINPTFFAF